LSWAAHDLEPYAFQRHLKLKVAFVPLLIGSYAPARRRLRRRFQDARALLVRPSETTNRPAGRQEVGP
jgi:hypothetical protein